MFSRLPQPPSLEEFARHIPRIDPVPEGVHRPFWSVMIPTYNRPKLLTETLESVLAQAPGPDEMQIEVCDNYSDVADIESLVKKVGGGRVEYFRQPKPNSDNFNTCIRRARGHWVHILHDDDMVLPGMYKAYREAIESLNPVMVLGRVISINQSGSWLGIIGPEPQDGIIADFVCRQAFSQLGQFAGTVVLRSVYESIGGFNHLLATVGDWDMWLRVGLSGNVATLSQPYGLYRVHSNSDTNGLLSSGRLIQEAFQLININLERLGATQDIKLKFEKGLAGLADWAERNAWILDAMGSTGGRLNQANLAWKLKPNPRRFVLLLKSWLKHHLLNLKSIGIAKSVPKSGSDAYGVLKA
jgi:glycosyltransferase involved in cell wall biosynthesis